MVVDTQLLDYSRRWISNLREKPGMVWSNGPLVLYHGTLEAAAIDLEMGKPDPSKGHKRRDFGQGFYTTRRLGQAESWANQLYRKALLKYRHNPRLHASNNLAKLPFDPSVRVPRARLRPRYGDGFGGAPLTAHRPQGEGRAAGGGANGAARQDSSAPAGADEP
jgi:hypothetical protein